MYTFERDLLASYQQDEDKPWTNDALEVARQIGRGVVVTLPEMVGQSMRRLAPDGSVVDELGRRIVENRREADAAWQPDLQGRGPIAETLIKGASSIGPWLPSVAASFIPGVGPYLGATLSPALYGVSQAQETEDKLRLQGVDPASATEAGVWTGLAQGAGELVANAAFMKLAGLARPVFQGARGGVQQAANTALDPRVIAPFLKQLGVTYATEAATEVGQDVATELIERAYGAAPTDLLEIAKDSAQGAVGMTTLLAPLGLRPAIRQSRRAQALNSMMQSPDMQERLAGLNLLAAQLQAEKLPEQELASWYDEQIKQLTTYSDADLAKAINTSGVINPYDAGGFLSRFEQGGETDITSPQRGLFDENQLPGNVATVEINPVLEQDAKATPTTAVPTELSPSELATAWLTYDKPEKIKKAKEYIGISSPRAVELVDQLADLYIKRQITDEEFVDKINAMAVDKRRSEAYKAVEGFIEGRRSAPNGSVDGSATTDVGQPGPSGRVGGDLGGRGTAVHGANVVRNRRVPTTPRNDRRNGTVDAARVAAPVAPASPVTPAAPDAPAAPTTPPAEAQPPGAQPPGAQPPGAQPPGAQPPGTQPPGAQSPGAQPPGAQPPGAQKRKQSRDEVIKEIVAKNPVVVNGKVNVDALEAFNGHLDPRVIKAVRYALNRDDDGTFMLKTLTLREAAQKAGLGNNSHAVVSRVLRAMGITPELRMRELAQGGVSVIPPVATEQSNETFAQQAAREATSDVRYDPEPETRGVESDVPAATRQAIANRITRTESPTVRKRVASYKSYEAVQQAGGYMTAPAKLVAKLYSDVSPKLAIIDSPSLPIEERNALRAMLGAITERVNRDPKFKQELGAELRKLQTDRTSGQTEEDADVDYSFAPQAGTDTHSAASLKQALSKYFDKAAIDKSVFVDTIYDLVGRVDPETLTKVTAAERQGRTPQAFVAGDKAYFIADSIAPGSELNVALHELGVHLGAEKNLPKEDFNYLVSSVKSFGATGSKLEKFVYQRAVDRAATADTLTDAELLAYFVEELGNFNITPTALKSHPRLRQFVNRIVSFVRRALQSIGVVPKRMTMQELIDAVYGMANLPRPAGITMYSPSAALPSFSYIGELAYHPTLRRANLDRAKEAYNNGADYTTIKRAFGWFFNPLDKKWRYELDSSQARFIKSFNFELPVIKESEITNRAKFLPLEQVLDYPDLYDAYPELRSIPFAKVAANNPKSWGWYQPAGIVQIEHIAVTTHAPDPLGTLLHEIQHWIQEYEKFARGGNADVALRHMTRENAKAFLQPFYQYWTDSIKLTKSLLKTFNLLNQGGYSAQLAVLADGDAWLENIANAADSEPNPILAAELGKQYFNEDSKLTKFANDLADELIDKLQLDVPNQMYDRFTFTLRDYAVHARNHSTLQLRKDVVDEYNESVRKRTAYDKGDMKFLLDEVETNIQRFTIYEHVFGEFEARDVSARSNLTAEERLRVPNYSSEKLDPAKLIVIQPQAWLTQAAPMMQWAPREVRQATPQMEQLSKNVKFSMRAPEGGLQSADKVEKNINKLPLQLRQPARIIAKTLQRIERKSVNAAVFTQTLLQRAANLGIPSALEYRDLYNRRAAFVGEYERRVALFIDAYHALPENEKGKDGEVNRILRDSTISGKWAYQPTWMSKDVEIDEILASKYSKLSDQAKKYIDDIFKFGRDSLEIKKATVLQYVASEYDALMEAAKKEGNTTDFETYAKEKALALRQFGSLMRLTSDKPYVPLRRFGPLVVVYKSPLYEQMEKEGDETELNKLKRNPEHYYVDFTETQAQAERTADKLRMAYGQDANITIREREIAAHEMYGGSGTLQALTKLQQYVRDHLAVSSNEVDQQVASRLSSLLSDMYLQTLSEDSARRAELRRRGVMGDIDMIRSFETQGRADAHFLGSVMYGQKMREALSKMRQEMREAPQPQAASEVYNEIVARYLQMTDYKPTPFADALNRLTTHWFLTLSPSYYIQNATQTWALTYPLLAGRFGMNKAAKVLSDAYSDLNKPFFESKLKHIDFEFLLSPQNKSLSKGEKDLLTAMHNRQILDIGQATELGQFRIEGQNKLINKGNQVIGVLRNILQKIEALNRVTAALAAYRLAIDNGYSVKDATQYAIDIVNETHGDYSSWNAPRVFNTAFGKVALQFRKFQLIQATLLINMMKNAVSQADAPEAKLERAVARRSLAFLLGQTFILGGARNLPVWGAIGLMLSMLFGEEDEPPEYLIRRAIGDNALADLLIGGFPAIAGVNTSSIGMGAAFSVLPFTDISLDTRAGMAQTVLSLLGGPLMGVGWKIADTATSLANGNYYRAVESATPRGPASVMRAVRLGTEGYTQQDGDQLVTPETYSLLDLTMQAIGFTPEVEVKRIINQRAAYRIQQALDQEEANIKKKYREAVKERDTAAMREAINEWNEYNNKLVRYGFARKPMQSLLRSPQEQRKREANTIGGVPYTRSSRGFAQTMAELD